MEGERKLFHGKRSFKKFMATKPALHRIMKELFGSEEKIKHVCLGYGFYCYDETQWPQLIL